MNSLIKHTGQVFTPEYLVKIILDEAGYFGPQILRKHCIDNSCGDGAFLTEIVRRYALEYFRQHGSYNGLSNEIFEYIHGIEIDGCAYDDCIENLTSISEKLSLNIERFDIIHDNALKISEFDGKMDYVIGNPPYVRVHNLDTSYSDVKSYSFASNGMTDLYLVFFEIGFKMLKAGGKLCYITPSSWLNSLAGNKLRNYIRKNRNLVSLIDLGHFQAFKSTTYTLISLFVKDRKFNEIAYNSFDSKTLSKKLVANIDIEEIDINGFFYLANKKTLSELKTILSSNTHKHVCVKNGLATLADKIFISSSFPFSHLTIPVFKASTGKWYKALFPYDTNGKPLNKDSIFSDAVIAQYLEEHKPYLLKSADEGSNPLWYLFGRTQALKDVFSDKLSVNTTVKDVKSLKVNFIPKGSGIYSGLYVMSDFDLDIIRSLILSTEFIDYVSALKKYKSGGYYTFNSKDLELYLNFHLQRM